MAKKTAFSVRAISDLVVAREPEHFVRLRIKLNGVAETILCPHDFVGLIEALRKDCMSMGIAIRGKHGIQMQRLGLVRRPGSSVRWYATALLRKHANALEKAFEDRYYKIIESVV